MTHSHGGPRRPRSARHPRGTPRAPTRRRPFAGTEARGAGRSAPRTLCRRPPPPPTCRPWAPLPSRKCGSRTASSHCRAWSAVSWSGRSAGAAPRARASCTSACGRPTPAARAPTPWRAYTRRSPRGRARSSWCYNRALLCFVAVGWAAQMICSKACTHKVSGAERGGPAHKRAVSGRSGGGTRATSGSRRCRRGGRRCRRALSFVVGAGVAAWR
mmetsp:Transcript_17909/g.37443  ORF Transcript_17909/g.37443 Transcript_17909/m.37443 type:complete len:215 (+) Transcript_17909:485-1129(+)